LLCVQIDAYNFHLGLLRPSLFGLAPQSLLGCREADVLMSSVIGDGRKGWRETLVPQFDLPKAGKRGPY
jgi:hypothetical protein